MGDKPTTDYLAIVNFSLGCGSYARGPNKLDTMNRLQRIAQSDWGTMLKPGSHECTAAIYDVTGHEKVYWDERGVWGEVENGDDVAIGNGERFTITLKGKKR